MNRYQLILKNENGTSIDVLDGFTSLSYARSLNTTGNMSVVLPYYATVQRDWRIEIWRSVDGLPMYLEGETYWIINKLRRTWERGKWTSTIEASDCLYLLDRILVAYTRDTVKADKTILNGNEEPADDMIKTYALENFGVGSTDLVGVIDRELPIAIEVDKSLGPTTEKQAGWQDLNRVFAELASNSKQDDTDLYYDIVYDPSGNTLTLRTFAGHRGRDLSNLYFGPEFGNVAGSFAIETDWTKEFSRVYVGGDGVGSGRTVQIVDFGDFPGEFGRVEYFLDERDIGATTVLQEEAYAEYYKLKAKTKAMGTTVDTPNLRYGRDYRYGDKVTIVANGEEIPAMIKSISITVDDGRESSREVAIESV